MAKPKNFVGFCVNNIIDVASLAVLMESACSINLRLRITQSASLTAN